MILSEFGSNLGGGGGIRGGPERASMAEVEEKEEAGLRLRF